ncbi:MAG: maltokinase N-terminal cap-like domain-containing protein [Planctomycetota bacterium]|jgi:maltose alpha-D-glucosyltransferase/alpha-amylase
MSGPASLLNDEARREQLEAALSSSLPRQKWYARKGEALSSVSVRDVVLLVSSERQNVCGLLLVDVTGESSQERPDCYVVPWQLSPASEAEPSGVLAVDDGETLIECSADPQFWQTLLQQTRAASIESLTGERLSLTETPDTWKTADIGQTKIDVSSAEQSNTAVTLGDWGFLKLFRRVEAGMNPDVEIGQFLTQQAPQVSTPRVLGTLELRGDSANEPLCLAVLLERVAAESDAWQFTLDALAGFWQRVARDCADWSADRIGTEADLSPLADQIGAFLADVNVLGRRTAELHSALASGSAASFVSEPLTESVLDEQRKRVTTELEDTCRLLRTTASVDDADALSEQLTIAGHRRVDEIMQRLAGLNDVSLIRVHGDYHLGQVLRTHDDFVIIDFEGEPDRPLAERREKRCAAKDVAGMIRSLHYASNAASVGLLPPPDNSIIAPDVWQRQWYVNCRDAFLAGYATSLTAAKIMPADAAAAAALLDMFVVEKVLYELRYEINHRPDWISIPLAGLQELLAVS